jgi:dTDP-glucose 4,6-dehydratase
MSSEHYVTGANGFIGRTLCQHVACLKGERDCYSTFGAKHIVDLAAYGNLYRQNDVREIMRANVIRLENLLNGADPYESFIVTSTSSLQLPVLNEYAISKGIAERLALAHAMTENRPICVIRPSSVTGIGEQEEHLIPKLIRSCLTGSEVPLVGKPTHDFIDVLDVVSAIFFIESHIDQCRGKVLNVSSGENHSNYEVLEVVERITGKKANVVPSSGMREYDSEHWAVDNSELRKMGWEPTSTLEQTIWKMITVISAGL